MVDLAFAPAQARAEVVAFMQEAFPRAKWGTAGWQTLLAGRWAQPADPCAVVARDGDRIVGVLGLVFATRPTAHGPRRWVNLTSWYVLPDYRGEGLGQRMMEMVVALPGATVTNFSSAVRAVPVVRRAGLQVLDDTRCLWSARISGAVRLAVKEDPQVDGHVGQVLRDHTGLPLRRIAVQTDEGPLIMVLMEARKHDAYVTHEVLFLSDPDRFAGHTRAVADAVLPTDRAMLSVDSRFVRDLSVAEVVEPIPVPRFYSSPDMTPTGIDPMYTEIVLLGMKMH